MDSQSLIPILFDPDSTNLKQIAGLLLERHIHVIQTGKVSELINSIGFNSCQYLSATHQIVIVGMDYQVGQTIDLVDFISRFKRDVQLFLYRTASEKMIDGISLPASLIGAENLEVHTDNARNIVSQIERFLLRRQLADGVVNMFTAKVPR